MYGGDASVLQWRYAATEVFGTEVLIGRSHFRHHSRDDLTRKSAVNIIQS